MENRLNYKYKFNHNPEYYFEHHLLAADFYDRFVIREQDDTAYRAKPSGEYHLLP